MSFLNYGTAKGLAYKHDFSKDMDRLYQQEAYRGQMQAKAEEKTRYYASLMKEANPVAPSMVKELEGFYAGLNEEIANFAVEHPNFEQDASLMSKFMGIADKYLNNDIVRKDLQSQEQFNILKQKFNAEEISPEQYEEEMERYTDFANNGGDGYVFSGKTLPDFDKIFSFHADTIKGSESRASVQDKQGLWWNETSINPNAHISEAQLAMSDKDKRKVIEKKYTEYNEQNPGIYSNATQFFAGVLKNSYGRERTLMGGQSSGSSKSGDDEKGKDLFFNLNIAGGWEIGKTIPGSPNQISFTKWDKIGGDYNFQQGDMVYIKNEKGEYQQIPIDGTWELVGMNGIEVKEDNGYTQMTVRARQNIHDGTGNTAKFWANIDGKTVEFSNLMQAQDELKALGWSNNDIKAATTKMTSLSQARKDGKDEITILDRDKNSKSIQIGYGQDPKKRDTILGWGFHEEGYSQLGLTIPGVDSEKGVHPTFSGTIYMPANITPQSISAYEQSFGVQHAQNVLSSGATANVQRTFNTLINAAITPGPGGKSNISPNNINAAMDFLNVNIGIPPKEQLTKNGKSASITDIVNSNLDLDKISVDISTPWMFGQDGSIVKYIVKDGGDNNTVVVSRHYYDRETGHHGPPEGKPAQVMHKKEWIDWYANNIDVIRQGYVSGTEE